MAVRARGYWVWVCAASAVACGGRSLVLDESSSGGSGSATTEPARPIAEAGAPAPTHHGADAGETSAHDASAHDDAGDAGSDVSLDGGEFGDASDFADAAGPSEPFDAGDPSWNTKDVVNPLPDQGPESSSCGQCAANEVCHPNVGCEPACDVPTGLDPNAAWPIGGGCATRRGLSRYSGLKNPKLAFSLGLGGSDADLSSAITLGENREIYVSGTSAGTPTTSGFLRIDRDGSGAFYPDWLGEVPLLGQNGVLYTVPVGLQATRRDGSALWSLRSGFGFPGPHDQEGEPVIGADGTIYSAGDFDDDTGLFAVSPAGQILWAIRTNSNVGMTTWPAIAKDGTIYFGAADGKLWAVSPGGKPLWQVSVGDYSWGFPALDHAQNIYLGNGTHLWSLAPGGQTRWERSVTVASDEQFVFGHVAIGPDGTVFAPFVDQQGGSFESGVRAYTADGTLRWSYQDAVYGVSTPVVDRDGILYLTTTNTLHAFSPSGGEVWSTQIPFEDGCASVVLGADGTTLVKCGASLYGFRESSP